MCAFWLALLCLSVEWAFQGEGIQVFWACYQASQFRASWDRLQGRD